MHSKLIDQHITTISPSGGKISLNLRELWDYREILGIFIWRDLTVRYKQTIVGSAWVIIQPLITMVVFTVLFGRLMKIPSEGVPYPTFAICGLVPWTYFTHALTKSCNSLLEQKDMISKIYFPRPLAPVASVAAGLVDFVVAFVILMAILFFYGITPTEKILAMPLWVLLLMMTALGIGFWLSAINIQYRDISNALPFIIHLGFFASPVFYPSSMIPEKWQMIVGLNPMVSIIEGIRWSLLGTKQQLNGQMLAISIVGIMSIFVSGLYFFRRREETFADVI